MTVYVDDFYKCAMGQFKRGNRTYKMSHMIADTDEELHAMAQALGLKMEWFQHASSWKRHYDVTMTVRAKAIALGAKEVSSTELVRIAKRRDNICI